MGVDFLAVDVILKSDTDFFMRSIRFEMIFEEINTTQLDVKFVLIMILEYFIPRLYQIQCKWDLIG